MERNIPKAIKARAVLVDVDNRTVVMNYGGSLMFPGGRLLDGESLQEGLRREIGEELGLGLENPEHLLTHRMRGRNYPTRRDEKEARRTTRTAYFIEQLSVELPTDRQGMLVVEGQKLSEREYQDALGAEVVALSGLREYVDLHQTMNPRQPFFKREMLNVIAMMERKGLIV